MEIIFRCFDTGKCGAFRMLEVHLDTPYPDSVLTEAWKRLFIAIDILCPCREDNCKTRSMRDTVIHAGKLMLQLMAAHQVIPSASGQTVVRQGRSPHQGCTCFVIFRIIDGNFSGINNRLQQSFCQMIGQCNIAVLAEIPFQRMHHDISDTAGSLIFADSIGQLRIHQCKQRTVQIAAKTTLEPAIFIGDYTRIAHLTASCGNSQNCADRQRFFQHTFAGREFPRVTVICSACCCRFGRIQYRAAANSQNHFDSFVNAQLCSLSGKGNLRVRLNAAQLDELDSVFVQGSDNPVIQTASLNAATAVMQQNLLEAIRTNHFSGFQFRTFAEHNLCRGIITKLFHVEQLLSAQTLSSFAFIIHPDSPSKQAVYCKHRQYGFSHNRGKHKHLNQSGHDGYRIQRAGLLQRHFRNADRYLPHNRRLLPLQQQSDRQLHHSCTGRQNLSHRWKPAVRCSADLCRHNPYQQKSPQ